MSGDDAERSYVAFVAGRQQALLRSAYLMTGDHHLAEDLVQVALTKLGARWERVREGDPEAFVRTVIYRDNVSWWRKHQRERLHADPPDVRTGDATGEVDSRLLLRTALQRLTPKQRAVVVMRFYDDLSEATTAQLLGVSVGTVKSQTHVALRRLREEIGLDLVDTTAGETT
jgi:RNA polymerase sigma-70 factor (sigma-E family)